MVRARAYVDGAVENNGNKNGTGIASGGTGVVVVGVEGSPVKGSRSFRGPTDQAEPGAVTNNRMELEAVLEAMRMRLRGDFDCEELVVRSDSAYVVNGWNEHLERWAARGWKTSEGSPVKNQDLWGHMMELSGRLEGAECAFRLEKVAGHSGDKNNEEADRLAVEACRRKTRSESYEATKAEWRRGEGDPGPERRPTRVKKKAFIRPEGR